MVGETASGEEALKLARELVPDVVLLDISMPGWNGLVTAQKITTACPATMIVMLTVSEDKDKLFAPFKAGARAYCSRVFPAASWCMWCALRPMVKSMSRLRSLQRCWFR